VRPPPYRPRNQGSLPRGIFEMFNVSGKRPQSIPPTRSETACRAEGPPPQGLRRDKLCRRREEGRTHLLIHVPIEEKDEHRWCLWRPITQALIPGRSLRVLWSKNRKDYGFKKPVSTKCTSVHEVPRTTKLDDRDDHHLTLDKVDRISV
jgi:hypothetical protein